MNTWKTIWDSFYKNSTRSALGREIWRLSSKKLRASLLITSIAFIGSICLYLTIFRNAAALGVMAISELLLLFAIDKAKETIFIGEQGLNKDGMIPPDKEAYRETRYMLFRKLLQEKGITKSHINDAFLIADSKLDLETSRGEISKKFLSFAIGLLTGLILALFRNLDSKTIITALALLALLSAALVNFLQIFPSRMERLKELKYFMRLYSFEHD